ncbi:MAG: hypothetical protein ACKO2K_16275 [Alphaproteobacteria bacterium]
MSGCATAAKGSLRLVVGSDPARNRLIYKWTNGTAAISQLGDPVNGDTSYALCLYADGLLAVEAVVPSNGASGQVRKAPWILIETGARYRLKEGSADGITGVDLMIGIGKARVGITGKGANLVLPALPLAAGSEVRAQFVKNPGSGPDCQESSFPAPFTRNKPPGFVASWP